MLSTRDPPQKKRPTQADSDGIQKIFQANRHKKKVGGAILRSDKIDFKTKAIKRDKEGHYLIFKGTINPTAGHNHCKHLHTT